LVIRSAAAAEAVRVCAGETVHLLLDIQYHRVPSLTCGVTVRVMPTFWRSMVWKGFCAPFVVPGIGEGAGDERHFWPTVINASWLSRVSRLGVDRILALVCSSGR
jgi:hypothetical protein